MSLAMLENIHMLPDPKKFKERMQSLAMLDAILMPEWQYRYFSFNDKWDAVESMGSLRDGEGDELFVLFTTKGAIGKALAGGRTIDRETIDSIASTSPACYRSFFSEPAFSPQDASFFFGTIFGRGSGAHRSKKRS